jgi:hypothetical protein
MFIMGKKANKKMKKMTLKAIKAVERPALKQAAKVFDQMTGTNQGDRIARMVQSHVDKKINKEIQRGAYGRGAYGRGSYIRPVSNSLFEGSAAQMNHMSSVGDETGATVISRKEYVTRVVAPPGGSFNNTSFSINPGLSGVFSWLSQIASNYDEYEFYNLVFSYHPVISTASTTGAMGSVIVACNYNAGAPKFSSFRQMVEYDGAVQSRICDPIIFGVECEPSKNAGHDSEYVRVGAVPVGQDIKTYDIGTFQFATSDVASTYAAGELLGHIYVEYTVILRKPKLYSALGYDILMDVIQGSVGSTLTLPFGTAPFAAKANTLGGVMSKSGTSRYTFPDNYVGTVAVMFWNNSSADSTGPPTMVASGNITEVVLTDTLTKVPSSYTIDSFIMKYFRVENATSDGTNFITLGVVGGSTFDSYLLVTEVNPLVVADDCPTVPF